MRHSKKILFLYTELAAYILDCFKSLASEGVEVHVVMYDVNPEAPFQLDLDLTNCKFYRSSKYTKEKLIELTKAINPAAIVCSGWIDPDYLQVVKYFKKDRTTVLALDSKEFRSPKSFLSLLRARLLYKKLFQIAWVPGRPQRRYAHLLGFEYQKIFMGFYTADVERLSKLEWQVNEAFPKRFVFVGRYVHFKGINELWKAFLSLDSQKWKLICAGTGPEFDKRVQNHRIEHLGFVQPDDLNTFVSHGGVFVLPSHKEPWGVVVHEFAAAGYPLICSESVGAADQFLKVGENGYLINPKSHTSLKAAMDRITTKTDQELWLMSNRSKELAKSITIEKWVLTAKKIIE